MKLTRGQLVSLFPEMKVQTMWSPHANEFIIISWGLSASRSHWVLLADRDHCSTWAHNDERQKSCLATPFKFKSLSGAFNKVQCVSLLTATPPLINSLEDIWDIIVTFIRSPWCRSFVHLLISLPCWVKLQILLPYLPQPPRGLYECHSWDFERTALRILEWILPGWMQVTKCSQKRWRTMWTNDRVTCGIRNEHYPIMDTHLSAFKFAFVIIYQHSSPLQRAPIQLHHHRP